jgi:methionine aminopeptidase
MSIETAEELAGMERAGKVTRAVLNAMKTAVRPGISTRELDEVGAAVMAVWEQDQLRSWCTPSREKAVSA